MQYEIIHNEKKHIQENKGVLSSLQKDSYQRDGFLVIKEFITADMCLALKKRIHHLINEFNPDTVKTIFSAKHDKHTKEQYFLDSGNNISFFFEEGAFDEKGNLKNDKQLCINKVGHVLHELDPDFFAFSYRPRNISLMRDLAIENPQIVQSMYICKQPHFGGEVTCHQDSTYLFVKETPITGLWFALEDATLENGCLWAIPGGHQTPLKSRLIRDKNNNVYTEKYDETPWNLDKMLPLEVPRGSVIILHGLLPHMSKENLSNRSRHAYTLHFMSARHEFAKNNWLQRN